MNDTVRLLDLLDRLAASAHRHLSASLVRQLAHASDRLRRRRHYAGITSLVGLAGGTGSGKSSLFNAIAQSEIVEAGAQRPTTAVPAVLAPSASASRLANLWNELGITEISSGGDHLGFVLLDLPDVDSLDTEHRSRVEQLLLDLDVVVWVTDPEKYRDRVLHDQFLRPLVSHSGRFVFVLNQIDRLSEAETSEVANDFTWALRQDGFANPAVWPVAADPGVGPALGIEELVGAIRNVAAEVGDGRARTTTEVGRLLEIIWPEVAPLDFNRRWKAALYAASEAWPKGRRDLLDFVDELANAAHELEGFNAEKLVEGIPSTLPPVEVGRLLDQTLGRELRERLRPRAETGAIAAELRLALTEAAGQ